MAFPNFNEKMWYDSEALFSEACDVPPYFTRINSLNLLKPTTHSLFPDPTEIKTLPEETEKSVERVKDSGLKYLAWQFEHIYDFFTIPDPTVPPILRGLYAFESDADIKECSDSLVQLVEKMRNSGVSGVLVVPNYSEREVYLADKILDGPEYLKPLEIPLVRVLKGKLSEKEKSGCIADGLQMIWLFRFCAYISGAMDTIVLNDPVNIELSSLATMLYYFIGVLGSDHLDVKIKAKAILAEAEPLLKVLSKGQAPEVVVQEDAVKKMVRAIDNLLCFKTLPQLKAMVVVIPSHAYSELIDLVWQANEPHAEILPLSCLGLSIYSDGGFPQKPTVKHYKRMGIDMEGQCAFSGALVASTGHVIAHWRYRVSVPIKSPAIPELLGVIFGLMLADYLGVPVNSRCDNLLAIRILSTILQARTTNLKMARSVVESFPVLNTLFKKVLSSPVACGCRLEWVRGHSGIVPNDLSDYLVEQAFYTSDLIDLDGMETAIQQLASTLPNLKKK
ncbi:hypothetical protein DSO57_1038627 [Entomophthora muscae]|uniref:Uncharacterized protein n=1 Tax=Entomophthora muscae TaxID=34485 RepID=A0ACC2SN44_9FUNG|nr:hypothetical protein DSO57_1038627 [Entomophthora muscae]